ncbi:MAG: hypothetical protein US76_01895 [Parcubacteria group bacterium GW2011_GWA2_38_13b]|nr:MAG: hypothetical protein US76_01895 [Parcubacteria group bacterium GW2011_GWA2_38_13b]
MRIALSADLKKIGALEVIPTPENFQDGIAVLKKAVLKAVSGKKIKAICGGVAGPLDKNKEKLVNAPNLRKWINGPLKKELEKVFDAPVYLENDANLAGLGEAVFGAGKNKDIVVYMTISTGVGGTRIVGGKIDKNVMGFEPGHQIIPCCNENGKIMSLENCVSGVAFKKRYQKEPYEILDKEIWDKTAESLAYGLNNTIVHWSPDIIVLGGSMMKKIGISIPRAVFYLKNINKIFLKIPPIKKAVLKDSGGIYGAMALLRGINKT